MAAQDRVGQHRLTSTPDDADILLFVDLHQHPDDPALRALRQHPYVLRWPERVRVYDERDRPHPTFPGIYVSGSNRRAVRGLTTGGAYSRLIVPWAEPTHGAADLLYSFMGARTHPVRDQVLALKTDRGYVEDTSAVDYFRLEDTQVSEGKARYRAVVERTKFVLCPRGHGPSSFRLFETLASGRVPVVISDDWLPPLGPAWDECSVQVAEKDVLTLPLLLKDREDDWQRLSEMARQVHAAFFADDVRFHHYVETLMTLQAGQRAHPWRIWDPHVLRTTVRTAQGRARKIVNR